MWKKIQVLLTYLFFVALWSFLTAISLFLKWLKGNKIFQRKMHKRPEVLDEIGTHKYVQLKDARLHYVETGSPSNPLMLLLHGFPEFWYSWRYQLKHFSKNYHVVAVDLRGYGESDRPAKKEAYNSTDIADDVKQLIEILSKDKVILVAHDWGGAIAWKVATTYPDIISKLIVLNCPHPLAMGQLFGKTWDQFLRSWYMLMFQVPYLPEFMIAAEDFGFLMEIFHSSQYGLQINKNNINAVDDEAWKYTFSQYGALNGPVNWYRCAMHSKAKINPQNLVKPETLIIWGTKDAFLVKEGAKLSQSFCENSRLEYIEGASHWVQQDCPNEVNKLIETFVGDISI